MTSIDNQAVPQAAPVSEKIGMWERKLLDLSLRNALLNLNPGRGCLPVAIEGGKALEALLLEERELSLNAWMPPDQPADAPAEDGDAPEDAPAALNAFEVLAGLKRGDLPQEDGLNLFAEERAMQAVAKRLYRAARTAMDETGAGTLFMGMGMLRWVDGKGQTRFAPLILIPVALYHRRLRWTLALRDGEADVNITLLEKLKREYEMDVPGLEPLPREKDGMIDLERVYAAFREAVSARGDWAVLDQSALANFSYGAFVMWNDLRRRERQLMDNAITRSLITGIRMEKPEPWEAEGEPFLPLDTDATQLEAVRAARRGESFVLHGPPGTGKSQTITTLIANLMADGRRVLFVAEKQAALDVVKKRLDAIGLGEYCVAMHAQGASTRNALNQLQRMLDLPEPAEVAEYADSLARAAQRAGALDDMFHAMRDPMPCGMDLYAAIQRREALKDCPDIDAPDDAWLDAMTPSTMDDVRRMLARLAASGRAVGHPAEFQLRGLKAENFVPERRDALRQGLADCRAALMRLGEAEAALADRLNMPRPVTQAEHTRLAVAAADAVFWEPEGRRGLRQLPDAQWLQLMSMVNHFVAAGRLRAQLVKGFRPEFLEQDGAALYAEWKSYSSNQILNRLRLAGLLRRVNAWSLKPMTEELLWAPLRALANMQSEEAAANADLDKYKALLGGDWQGERTDWVALQERLSRAQAHAGQFGGQAWLTPMREKMLADAGAMALCREVDACRERIGRINKSLGEVKGTERADGDWLQARLAHCDAALEALGKAGDWLAWLRCADEARAMGLDAVVHAYEQGMDPGDLWPAFEKAVCGALAARRIQADPGLSQFTGRMADALSEEFRALDAERAGWSRLALARKLYERRSGIIEAAAQTPALSRLRRACASKRSGYSLRQLFEQIPELMAGLCGCMMMNPVSVAQFLPESLDDFDVVIFDEASQLLTSRAVGALSRARAAIVVGDPNQMPPTTFFAAVATEVDDPDLEDLESVLDDCMAVGMPSRSLKWHYRSRHESLIAFSNRAFYEGRLATFPSADARTPHVRTVRVDGVFERSGRRVNQAEARAVLDELVRRAHDPRLSQRSVGVVTFNLAQQNLIDDLVTAAAADDPALAAWIERAPEPLFIKNLENVQGDERDVILFCVGYGPDADGAVHMNFGPLNREGGWRRLNVAVTRAREEMLLFTSMEPTDIRVGHATPRGVSALREFMEYAAGGGATDAGSAAPQGAPDGIAQALCEGLARAGWQTERNVGRSDFRVSVAVIDPDDPGRYRLGVLLDDCPVATSARDREITRLAVLGGLGWSLTRLYALDWRRNPQGELQRVLDLLGGAASDK